MMGVSHMPMFFDQDAIVMIRHILLLMLCRNEWKRAVMKTDTGYLCVEPVPEDIASSQVLVILAKEIDETYEPVYPIEAFAFVGPEILSF